MATWHQQRRPIQLAHPTRWRIVTNPPGECMSCMTFPDEQSAREALTLWKAKGDEYSYLVAPQAKS